MTGLYCTNCNKELEEYEEVTVVHGGVVEPFLDQDYFIADDDSPYIHTLCGECASKLVLQVEQRPNRVVIEVEGNVVTTVRAERPSELHVTVLDRDLGRWFASHHEVEQLNTVKEVGDG